jgi:hypothetical protein
LVNWVLGSLIVRDKLPTWAMLLANPPFGYVYVWTESLWLGEGYQIGEKAVMVWQLGAHLAQIFLYFGAWLIWEWYRSKPVQLQEKDRHGGRQPRRREDD